MAKLTKAHHICQLLVNHGPMTREQLTRGAWIMEGCQLPYKATSNGCYFLTGSNGGGQPSGYSPYVPNRNEYKSSLILKGLIQIVGKRGRTFLYDVTPAGRAFIGA